MKRIVVILAAAGALGCSGSAVINAAGESVTCHAGFELVDGVCVVEEIYFEGGTFTMGRGWCHPPEQHEAEFADARCEISDEPHTRTVAPFYMDAVEYTETEHVQASIEASGGEDPCPSLSLECNPPHRWQPFGMSRESALAFCGYLGKTLPTEAQWEFAATAGGTRTYPWGEHEPGCADAAIDDERCPESNGEVAQYPPSAEGLYDMAGGLAELVVNDDGFYTEGYPEPPLVECPDCYDPTPRPGSVVRGGSLADPTYRFRGAHRGTFFNSTRIPGQGRFVGHRCVRNP